MTDIRHASGSSGRFTELPTLQEALERSLEAGTELTAVFVEGDPPTAGDRTPASGDGDTPPPRFAAPLAARVRETDLLLLLGGEALLCLLPGLGADDAGRRFDDIAGGLGCPGVRVGIAEPRPGEGIAELVTRAQAAATMQPDADGDPTRLSLRLTAGPRAARHARVALRTFEDEMHADELALLALVVTELVTNSVRHGTSDAVEVELGVGEGMLHGAVLDHGDGFVPATPSSGAPNAREGLGLAMVERASARWGTSDEGRRVWFELRLGDAAG